ncbi:helix-turn-helix domain-containing protein [Planococcus antarcticus DSM 14505]|uniref:Helix-turn-helix domain-containing protein n=1 Tax=Planococcus antarcticus DSM 14505 TaxID=1185653 RepID=A0AA87INF5_9BACL|nr:helix-turn-helix domain-containing protein [Planococcus antarcticus]EIM07966.1 helix-turn-helix domain-containing protein [Planococcus antarcticus DSM 14505]
MTEDQFFNGLQSSLGQAIAHAKGEPSKARTKTVEIKELALFTAEDIKSLRLQMNLTQKSFAALMGVSIKAIESWERGTNQPSGSARRLLEILRNQPHVAEEQEIISV